MKIRSAAMFMLLISTLAACYSSGDITPPPDYQIPSPEQTLVTPSKTSQATTTSEVPPSTAGITGPNNENRASELTATPSASSVSVSGIITNSSGTLSAGDLTVSLYLYNPATSQVDQTLTAPVGIDGSFNFSQVGASSGISLVAGSVYQNVYYFSSPVAFDPAVLSYSLPVSVYDATDDLTHLTTEQFHLEFDFSTPGTVQIRALYILSNSGSEAVVFQTDGTGIPFILIPAGAGEAQYGLASGSSQLSTADGGYALLPGAQNQYGILALFSYPYFKNLKLDQSFNLPVSAITVIVPEGVRVSSKQLTDAGLQTSNGIGYHLYQGGSLVSGTTLSLTVSGKPGSSTGFQFNQKTIVMIAVGVVGILFIGLGLFLFLRDRARSHREDLEDREENQKDTDSIGDDADSIMDAIIALDDMYKNADIPKEAYKKRRADLKKRLRKIQ